MLTNMYKPACKHVSNLTRATLQHAVAWLTSNLRASGSRQHVIEMQQKHNTSDPLRIHEVKQETHRGHMTCMSQHATETHIVHLIQAIQLSIDQRHQRLRKGLTLMSMHTSLNHLRPKAHQKLNFTQQLVPTSPTKSFWWYTQTPRSALCIAAKQLKVFPSAGVEPAAYRHTGG